MHVRLLKWIELSKLATEADTHIADGTVTVLGNDEVADPLGVKARQTSSAAPGVTPGADAGNPFGQTFNVGASDFNPMATDDEESDFPY